MLESEEQNNIFILVADLYNDTANCFSRCEILELEVIYDCL